MRNNQLHLKTAISVIFMKNKYKSKWDLVLKLYYVSCIYMSSNLSVFTVSKAFIIIIQL